MFIFTSGVSTAKEVTDISGRGVGMDVVKKEVEKLRKKLSDRDSAREYLKTLVNKDSNSLLLKELLQKYLGEWQPSYTEKELCHCRAVDTDLVIDSIYLGANDIEKIGKMCSAGTSCGTCQPDSLNLLQDFS